MNSAQKAVLKEITEYISENGYGPAVSDIAKSLNVYPNAVQEQIKRLERDGYITKSAGVARSIRLTDKAESL